MSFCQTCQRIISPVSDACAVDQGLLCICAMPRPGAPIISDQLYDEKGRALYANPTTEHKQE